VRLLFLKHLLTWPRSSGHDVGAYYMMKACGELGHTIALSYSTEPSPAALNGLRLDSRFSLSAGDAPAVADTSATWLQRRFQSFWGNQPAQIARLRQVVGEWRPDAVIAFGLEVLGYFPALTGITRVWCAADEWIWHHLSQALLCDGSIGEHIRGAAIKGLYERAYASAVDRVWVVSDGERRAMRWLGGMRRVDVVPYGVDAEYYRPGGETPEDWTAVFWGRLDFGPNIQGLQWFVRNVWPIIRSRVPEARFTIIGFNVTPAVRGLSDRDGISLLPDVPDLRQTVRRHSVVVLPLVSGGGIKNKLLEAAALGLPIVCTPRATLGLCGSLAGVLETASDPAQFADSLIGLWRDAARRRLVGAAARAWVLRHHTWTAAAERALGALTA
jgi:glycosyltransferase involved in cell wall biosynthesis